MNSAYAPRVNHVYTFRICTLSCRLNPGSSSLSNGGLPTIARAIASTRTPKSCSGAISPIRTRVGMRRSHPWSLGKKFSFILSSYPAKIMAYWPMYFCVHWMSTPSTSPE